MYIYDMYVYVLVLVNLDIVLSNPFITNVPIIFP